MKTIRGMRWIPAFLVSVFFAVAAEAGPRSATQNGNWSDTATWGGTALQVGDDVLVGSGRSVTTDVTTVWLASFTNAGTLVFTGTNSALQAAEVILGGTLKHPPQSDTNGLDGWYADHRVWLVCTNLLLATNGTIDVSGMGYGGAPIVDYQRGYGPGGGVRSDTPTSASGGGGYGGRGSWTGGGTNYGSAAAPVDPGSGGGDGWGSVGGAGGGLVRIEAAGRVTVNGIINVNGAKTGISGGSGGGLYITCNTFAGTNGYLSADGGGGNAASHQANGGGGRIAVVYDPPSQASLNATAKPVVRFSANRGVAIGGNMGRPGTLYFPDAGFFPSTNLMGGEIVIPDFTAWSPAAVTIGSNGFVVLPQQFRLEVTNDLTIATSGSGLEFTNGQLRVGGNLKVDAGTLNVLSAAANCSTVVVAGVFTVTNGGAFWIYSGATNGPTPDYGALVAVSNELRVHANSWVYPYSHSTNGGSVKFELRNLSVAAGGGFDANGAGFWGGIRLLAPLHQVSGPARGSAAAIRAGAATEAWGAVEWVSEE